MLYYLAAFTFQKQHVDDDKHDADTDKIWQY